MYKVTGVQTCIGITIEPAFDGKEINMLSKRTMEIFEKNDIYLCDRDEQDGEFCREIEFYSDAGEDVIEIVWYDGTDEGFINGFRTMTDDFDTDEHAEMWVESRGKNGVPNSIKELLEDAEGIKSTLEKVADELENIVNDEMESLSLKEKIEMIKEILSERNCVADNQEFGLSYGQAIGYLDRIEEIIAK